MLPKSIKMAFVACFTGIILLSCHSNGFKSNITSVNIAHDNVITPRRVKELIGLSVKPYSFFSEDAIKKCDAFSDIELKSAFQYILNHPDFSAYYVLRFLKIKHNKQYDCLPDGIKAAIMFSALNEKCPYEFRMNRVNDSDMFVLVSNSEMISELVSMQRIALYSLLPVLKNTYKAASYSISSSQNITPENHYRVCDIAFAIGMKILKKEPILHIKLEQRNRDILILIDEIYKIISDTKSFVLQNENINMELPPITYDMLPLDDPNMLNGQESNP